MFEKKKKELFPWKISALILVGVFVLSSGVYIGTRLKHNGVQTGEVVSTSANMNEKSKEAFGLIKIVKFGFKVKAKMKLTIREHLQWQE